MKISGDAGHIGDIFDTHSGTVGSNNEWETNNTNFKEQLSVVKDIQTGNINRLWKNNYNDQKSYMPLQHINKHNLGVFLKKILKITMNQTKTYVATG